MSVPPPPYTQRNTSTDPKEDCRDYLRTGRCKYGASCKYNHPANVQSGGGMKGPIDPSEPMFPLRPNEPPCVYYMKHGTCKFGQTCKFHHPPMSSLSSGGNGNSLLVGVGRKNDSQHLMWNGGGENGVQVLPQRPGEPNCIFFLKNGRCKYGSTCRYHHPLNYHEKRSGDDGRRQQVQVQVPADSMLSQAKIHYVTSLPPGSYQHGHFVVADGTVAFLSIDGSAPSQVISVPQGGNESAVVYTTQGANSMNGRPLSQRSEAQSSSSTSISSTYENSASNVDHHGQHGDTSSLWNRGPKSGNGGSMNAYGMNESSSHGRPHSMHGSRNSLQQEAHDSSRGLPRVVSSGSSSHSDAGQVFYDAATGQTRPIHSNTPSGNGLPWRDRRSASFDHTVGTSFHSQNEDYREGLSQSRRMDGERSHSFHQERQQQRSAVARSRPQGNNSRGQARPQQNAEVDDGLSMMTSALLTMLDTPEEAGKQQFQGYDYEDHQQQQRIASSQMPTSRMNPQYTSSSRGISPPSPDHPENYASSRMNYVHQGQGSYYDQSALDERYMGVVAADSRSHYHQLERMHNQTTENVQGWSQNWNSHHQQVDQSLKDNTQSMSGGRNQRQNQNSPPQSSPLSLYLP